MLKPNATYKMSKPTKTMLALSGFRNDNDRHAWKNAMIGAELASRVVVKQAPRDSKRPQGTTSYQTNDTGTASTAS